MERMFINKIQFKKIIGEHSRDTMLLHIIIEKRKLSPNNQADTIKRINIPINLTNVDIFIAIKRFTCSVQFWIFIASRTPGEGEKFKNSNMLVWKPARFGTDAFKQKIWNVIKENQQNQTTLFRDTTCSMYSTYVHSPLKQAR